MLAGLLVTAGCGNTSDVEVQPVPTLDPSGDAVAFLPTGSDTVMVMAADGSNVRPGEMTDAPTPTWPEQQKVIAMVCGMSAEAPIEVVSPGGAPLGPLDDTNWTPEISPIEPFVLVACGRDDDGTVLLVSSAKVEGSRTGWARSGRGDLSDRIEIRAVAIDGSAVVEVTSNEAGDWLPRWSPDGSTVVFETNRDGNSEVYTVETATRTVTRLTDSDDPDLAPVWSRDGGFVAYRTTQNGTPAVQTVQADGARARSTGIAGNPVLWDG